MKLEVVDPWYKEGLTFTCTQCGNCCTGGPGFVWVSKQEIARLAEFLNLTPKEVRERHTRKVFGRVSLNENIRGQMHDCTFLRETKVTQTDPTTGDIVTYTRRGCAVYTVRPLQCRTWPFWTENLETPDAWAHAAKRCPGMNHGSRRFTLPQIEGIRDAADWPANPPTSGNPPNAGDEPVTIQLDER